MRQASGTTMPYRDPEQGREAKRRRNLRRRFGITTADYDTMLARQGGRCLICGKPPVTRRLNVDHEHRTGRIRGLLCFQCNRQLLPALEHYRHLVERGLLYLDGYLTEPPD